MLSGYTQIPANGAARRGPRHARPSSHARRTRDEATTRTPRRGTRRGRERADRRERAPSARSPRCCRLAASAPRLRPRATRGRKPGHLRIGVVRTLDNLNPLLSGQAGDDRHRAVPVQRPDPLRRPRRTDPGRRDAWSRRAPTAGSARDGKTIIYHLRPNVRFSDGTPLTADDVVFTWQQVHQPAQQRPVPFSVRPGRERRRERRAHRRRALARAVRAVRARTSSAAARKARSCPSTCSPVKPDLNRDPFNIKPVGSGPYMVERYDINQTIEMVPNPYWFGGKPGLQRVTYRIIPSENTLLVSLRTHEIDFYYARARAAVPRAARACAAYDRHRDPVVAVRDAGVQRAAARRFADMRVRRAVARAIDWQALARTVYLDVDLPDWGDIFPRSWAYTAAARSVAVRSGSCARAARRRRLETRPRRDSREGRQAARARDRRRSPASSRARTPRC